LHPAKTSTNNETIKSESLLLHARFGSAIATAQIHVQNLLLPSVQDDSAMMMETHAGYSLQLIVESFSMGAQQVAPATIHNHSFKLIDALASEGALFAPYIFEDAFTYANKLNHEAAWAQATSFLASNLIVNYSKISLHFHKDCGIFCEGEWGEQQQFDGHTGLGGFNLNGHICLVDQNGIVGSTGPNDLICVIGLIGHICITSHIGCNGLIGNFGRNDLINRNGLIGLNVSGVGLIVIIWQLIGLNGFNGLSNGLNCLGGTKGLNGFNGLIGLGLIGFIGLAGLIDHNGLNDYIGHSGFVDCIGLVSLIALVKLIGFVNLVSLMSLIGYTSLIGHNGLFGYGLVGHTGLVVLFSLAGLGFVLNYGIIGFIGIVGLVGLLLGHISLIGLVSLIGLICFIGLVGLIGFSLNGLIGISVLLSASDLKSKQNHLDVIYL
jgi:hypothetical protein